MSESDNFDLKGSKDFLKNMSFVLLGLVITNFFLNKNKIPQLGTSKFDEILKIVDNNYVDSLDIQFEESEAVSQLLSNLDPHSVYISAKDLKEANEQLEGNFSGIGVEFYIAQDTLVVVSPIAGGPSELAGIRSGDKIVKIDDSVVAGVKIENAQVYKRLRGNQGTDVKLHIMRQYDVLPPFKIKRDIIKVNSVEPSFMLDSTTGYIKINTFGENTYTEFFNELKKLKNVYPLKGLVIDLRQNSGGFLEIAVAILDELISGNKLLVYTEGRHYPKEEFSSGNNGLFEKGDLSILIDEGSASASEIVAGAVQDLDRGVIVGRRSFGKGLVQNQYALSDGSAIRLTIAKYYTPSGRNIQKPYHNTNYEEELYDRYKHGEFYSESLQTVNDTVNYYTANGRKVKAGGGIYPDIFVSIDTNYDMVNFAILRSIVPEYVYSNYTKFNGIVSKYNSLNDFMKNFQVNNDMVKEFANYCKKVNPKWNNQKENTYNNRAKLVIKAFIAKQFYGTIGYMEVMSQSDESILKALKSIHNHNKIIDQNGISPSASKQNR